jgi:hypothetical protein
MSRSFRALAVVVLALASVAVPSPARGAVAYDAAYVGESVFVTVAQGELATFSVIFANTGSDAWIRGTPSEVVLGACSEDKLTCGVPSARSDWNARWVSGLVYATQAPDVVEPGKVAFFTYSVRAPMTAIKGTYLFNGEVLLASTLKPIHAVGYYHQATIVVPPAPPAVFPQPSSAPTVTTPAAPASAPTPPPPPPPLPPPPPPPPPPAGH